VALQVTTAWVHPMASIYMTGKYEKCRILKYQVGLLNFVSANTSVGTGTGTSSE